MLINKTTTWFSATMIMAFLLKLWHNHSETQDLYFMLWPASNFIEILFNTNSYWNTSGFHFHELPLQMDKYYSGGNLFVFSFLIVSASAPYYLFNTFKAFLLFLGTLGIAYGFTVAVNVVKFIITLVMYALRGAPLWMDNPRVIRIEHFLIHITSLLIIYLLMRYCFTKLKRHILEHHSVYSLNKLKS
ncbi:MAG TPA: hypothetical protein VGK59_17190 [Ohtaekwangia sp.]